MSPRYLVIRCFDRNAGFTALLTNALNGIRIAERENRIPVLNWDAEFVRHFHQPERGENVWNYFFESAGDISYSQLKDALRTGTIPRIQVRWLTSLESYYLHSDSPDRIATFWSDDQYSTAEEFFRERRDIARELIGRYVEVDESIRNEVDQIESEWNVEKLGPIWGVHIRGTDLIYTTPVGIQRYFSAIRQRMNFEQTERVRIWLATDQAQFVDSFRKEFGSNSILSQNCLRGSSAVAPFKMEEGGGYSKGREVLVDILALSRCSLLFKGPAAVGEAALWFGRSVEVVDLTPPPGDREEYSFGSSPAAVVTGVIRNPVQKGRAVWAEFIERHVYAYGPNKGLRETALRLARMIWRWQKLRKAAYEFRDWDSRLSNLSPRAPDAEDGEPEFDFPEGTWLFKEVRASGELICPTGTWPDGWTRCRASMRVWMSERGRFYLQGQSMADRDIVVKIRCNKSKIREQRLRPGHFSVAIPIASSGTFEIELTFDHEWQLDPPDERIVSVWLEKAGYTREDG